MQWTCPAWKRRSWERDRFCGGPLGLGTHSFKGFGWTAAEQRPAQGEAAREGRLATAPCPGSRPACSTRPRCQRARRAEPTPTGAHRVCGAPGGLAVRPGRGGCVSRLLRPTPGSETLCWNPKRRWGGGPAWATRSAPPPAPAGPGVSRAPTCQPSLPDVFPQSIPGSGGGVPQLLTDGSPELHLERFPFAGHFRSVLITTNGLATAAPSWPATQTPGDSRCQTQDSGWGPGTRRRRDMGPPSRAGPGRVATRAPCGYSLRSVNSSTLFPLSLGPALLRSPPSPSLPLSPGLPSAPLLPRRSVCPALPPSPKPDSLVPMAPLAEFHPLFNVTQRSRAVPYSYFLIVSIFQSQKPPPTQP